MREGRRCCGNDVGGCGSGVDGRGQIAAGHRAEPGGFRWVAGSYLGR